MGPSNILMAMSLSSLQLDAFMEVVRRGSFSQAAKSLHITQSALSQRVLNLEESLGVAVLVRGERVIKPTAIGERLAAYCRDREALESEFLESIASSCDGALAGTVSIASFSTFGRSILLPALAAIKEHHPSVQFELLIRDLDEIPELLRSGRCDFVFFPNSFASPSTRCVHVATERYVLVESARLHDDNRDVYIDIHENDRITVDFWNLQKERPTTMRRVFFDDIYAIIDAVAYGFGRAIVPSHLLAERPDLVQVGPHLEPLLMPVYLCFQSRSTPSQLHRTMQEALLDLS